MRLSQGTTSIANDLLRLPCSDRMGLDGSIPGEIGILTTLNVLDLTFNDKLVGSFNEALCDLIYLDSLYLGHTHISDELPACIGNLENLRSLFVSRKDSYYPCSSSLTNSLSLHILAVLVQFSDFISFMFFSCPIHSWQGRCRSACPHLTAWKRS
jgi:Leucine-rich repeat (LRR) protein